MLNHLIQGNTYTRQKLAAIGFPGISIWKRCVYPRPPDDWCVLLVTLNGRHDYANALQGQQLIMSGNDRDRVVNEWLTASAVAGHRVGLLLREVEAQPFIYRGEVTLASANTNPTYFVWDIP